MKKIKDADIISLINDRSAWACQNGVEYEIETLSKISYYLSSRFGGVMSPLQNYYLQKSSGRLLFAKGSITIEKANKSTCELKTVKNKPLRYTTKEKENEKMYKVNFYNLSRSIIIDIIDNNKDDVIALDRIDMEITDYGLKDVDDYNFITGYLYALIKELR